MVATSYDKWVTGRAPDYICGGGGRVEGTQRRIFNAKGGQWKTEEPRIIPVNKLGDQLQPVVEEKKKDEFKFEFKYGSI